MDKRTHSYLTLLLYITFLFGYSIILLLNNNPVKPLLIFTIILLLTIYSHKKYYSHDFVNDKGKIFLVINLFLTYLLLYFDYSNYEQLFILLLLGDSILGYSLKYSVKYVVFIHITYYPYAYYFLYRRPIGEYSGDLLRDFVIISFVVFILYVSKYQINEKMKYNELLIQRDDALSRIKEMALNEERNRVALILHNSLGHLLVSTNMTLQAEKMELITQGKIDKDAFKQTEKQISEAIALLRQTIHNHDDLLLGMSLSKFFNMLIRDVLNNTKIKMNYNEIGIEFIKEDYKNLVYNIILETVNNSLKHSKCNTIDILLQASEKDIKIIVTDNGKGFNNFRIGFGISKIKEQVHEYNGSYNIISNNGCRVEVYIPVGEMLDV